MRGAGLREARLRAEAFAAARFERAADPVRFAAVCFERVAEGLRFADARFELAVEALRVAVARFERADELAVFADARFAAFDALARAGAFRAAFFAAAAGFAALVCRAEEAFFAARSPSPGVRALDPFFSAAAAAEFAFAERDCALDRPGAPALAEPATSTPRS